MYRKWKGAAALGMAALIGFLMPMGTMMAAEDNPEVVQEVETGSEADAADNNEAILDDSENVGGEEDAVTDENVDDEINADDEIADDEVSVDDENAEDEVDADDEIADEVDVDDVIADDEVESDNDGNDGVEVMSEAEAEDVEVQASSDAPVINITLNGESCKYDLGGKIEYKYIKDTDPKLAFSASQNSNPITFYYYLDNNPSITAMGEDQIEWSNCNYSLSPVAQILSNNKTYVVYVKAEADGQTVYARSCGIVVDTEAPVVTGVTDGGTCPEGTTFKVSDTNLESVTVNGKLVTPDANGNYQVTAAGTSCEIIAKDKAGNETPCNITVTARSPEADGTISTNGTYSLTAGTSYKLGEGQWQVSGDKSVYSGGNTFYVKTDGDYSFTKR